LYLSELGSFGLERESEEGSSKPHVGRHGYGQNGNKSRKWTRANIVIVAWESAVSLKGRGQLSPWNKEWESAEGVTTQRENKEDNRD
jgi:hypothetical protein